MVRLGEVVWLPRKYFTEQVRKALTVKHFNLGSKEATEVYGYRVTRSEVGVPRAYGLKLISDLGLVYEDVRSKGKSVTFPKKVEHTGDYAYQQAFVEDIVDAAWDYGDFLIEAATGKGKTVCSLSAIEKIGRNALIIVDQDNLKTQWIAEIGRHLGLPPEKVGVVQGPKCLYKGYKIVVAMMQTLTRKDLPKDFYNHFGVVCFDECHTTGAPTFSEVLTKFSAAIRFGVSATIDRRDSLQKLIHLNLGEVRARLVDKHEKSYVYYLESDTVYSWYANISPKTGRILTEVAEDTNRNELISFAAKWLYDSGRDVLLLSDRIEQLETLMALCELQGIPKEDLGLYCGYRTVWAFAKDPTPHRKPVGYVKGTAYTPVIFTPVKKRIPKKELDAVKESKRVLFATYGMFSKGVDVPRLAGGIDCTGRSRAEQIHGRILRKKEGKLVPLWITLRDINSYRLDWQFLKRVGEYVSSSAEIYQWKPDKGIRAVEYDDLVLKVSKNVKKLKRMEIQTQSDGRHMLVMPSVEIS